MLVRFVCSTRSVATWLVVGVLLTILTGTRCANIATWDPATVEIGGTTFLSLTIDPRLPGNLTVTWPDGSRSTVRNEFNQVEFGFLHTVCTAGTVDVTYHEVGQVTPLFTALTIQIRVSTTTPDFGWLHHFRDSNTSVKVEYPRYQSILSYAPYQETDSIERLITDIAIDNNQFVSRAIKQSTVTNSAGISLRGFYNLSASVTSQFDSSLVMIGASIDPSNSNTLLIEVEQSSFKAVGNAPMTISRVGSHLYNVDVDIDQSSMIFVMVSFSASNNTLITELLKVDLILSLYDVIWSSQDVMFHKLKLCVNPSGTNYFLLGGVEVVGTYNDLSAQYRFMLSRLDFVDPGATAPVTFHTKFTTYSNDTIHQVTGLFVESGSGSIYMTGVFSQNMSFDNSQIRDIVVTMPSRREYFLWCVDISMIGRRVVYTESGGSESAFSSYFASVDVRPHDGLVAWVFNSWRFSIDVKLAADSGTIVPLIQRNAARIGSTEQAFLLLIDQSGALVSWTHSISTSPDGATAYDVRFGPTGDRLTALIGTDGRFGWTESDCTGFSNTALGTKWYTLSEFRIETPKSGAPCATRVVNFFAQQSSISSMDWLSETRIVAGGSYIQNHFTSTGGTQLALIDAQLNQLSQVRHFNSNQVVVRAIPHRNLVVLLIIDNNDQLPGLSHNSGSVRSFLRLLSAQDISTEFDSFTFNTDVSVLDFSIDSQSRIHVVGTLFSTSTMGGTENSVVVMTFEIGGPNNLSLVRQSALQQGQGARIRTIRLSSSTEALYIVASSNGLVLHRLDPSTLAPISNNVTLLSGIKIVLNAICPLPISANAAMIAVTNQLLRQHITFTVNSTTGELENPSVTDLLQYRSLRAVDCASDDTYSWVMLATTEDNRIEAPSALLLRSSFLSGAKEFYRPSRNRRAPPFLNTLAPGSLTITPGGKVFIAGNYDASPLLWQDCLLGDRVFETEPPYHLSNSAVINLGQISAGFSTPLPTPTPTPTPTLAPTPTPAPPPSPTPAPLPLSTPTPLPSPSSTPIPTPTSTPTPTPGSAASPVNSSPTGSGSNTTTSPPPSIGDSLLTPPSPSPIDSPGAATPTPGPTTMPIVNSTSSTVIIVTSDSGGTVATISVPSSDRSSIVVLQPDPLLVSLAEQQDPGLAETEVLDIRYFVDGVERALPSTIEICFVSNKNRGDRCLGYIDPKTARWRCEDKCLERKSSQLCGKTSHLTSFAILLRGGNGDECDAFGLYMTGTFEYDVAIIMPVVGVILIVCLIACFIFSCTEYGRQILYGKEGYRVLKSRIAQQSAIDFDEESM